MQDIITYIVVSILSGAVVAFVLWFTIGRRITEKDTSDSTALPLLQNQIHQMSETLDRRLKDLDSQFHSTNKDMRAAVTSQFNESSKLISSINKNVTEQLVSVSQSVTEVQQKSTKFIEIADALRDLEKTLKHQKQRGNLGEKSLELILQNILPPDIYSMQYAFKDGSTVDAVINTKDGIIPIDAKFSLDNYTRLLNAETDLEKESFTKDFHKDIKVRIDETAKYIKPNEGTLPFAFMYIPAEGIYYDLLVNEVGKGTGSARSLLDYAYRDKNVIIVSPTTFAAYLQSVLYGFRAFKIEESAKEIRHNVELLSQHVAKLDGSFKKLGNTLNTAVNHYDSSQRQLRLLDKDVYKISDARTDVELLDMEKVQKSETE